MRWVAESAVGVDPTSYKVTSFVISAMGGGVAGALLASMRDGNPTVQPEQFNFLCGFFGGRRYYHELHGHMNLREIHAHVEIRKQDAEEQIPRQHLDRLIDEVRGVERVLQLDALFLQVADRLILRLRQHRPPS